jgi:hypothetical protein
MWVEFIVQGLYNLFFKSALKCLCFCHFPIKKKTLQKSVGALLFVGVPFQVQKDRLPDKVNFRISIPGAEAVAVVAGQDWTHLERTGGIEWAGPVKVGQVYGTNTKVTLNANYGGDKSSYATLLEYVL